MPDPTEPAHPLRTWRPDMPVDRLQRPHLAEQLHNIADRAEALARDLRAAIAQMSNPT